MKTTLLCSLVVAGTALGGDIQDDDWIFAVGTLFPDTANVLVSEFGFEVSLDCDPVSVAQNHFWFEWYLLPPPLQQHEAGCWFAYDFAVEVCMRRAAICTPPEEMYAGVGEGWLQECVGTAQDLRDNHCPPPKPAVPFEDNNNAVE